MHAQQTEASGAEAQTPQVQTDAATPAKAATEGLFRVVSAETRLDEGIHRLNADLELRFSTEALEAIENGVPMSIVIEMEVLRERAIWDEVVARPNAEFRVENHPLTTLYVIRDINAGIARTFRTRASMVRALGAVRDLSVIPDANLDPEERYRLRVRAALYIEALPAPLRPLAYLSSPWRLRSEWHTRSLRPAPASRQDPQAAARPPGTRSLSPQIQ